jgi:hypothetical protein
MDEMGHQVWSDAIDTVCFVPNDENLSVVYYPVAREGKRITLIACIAADGSYMRPALILARKTFEDEVLETGLTRRKLELYRNQPHSFINTEIFEDWFQDTFCPELRERRRLFNYDGPAFLLLDNCSAHHGEIFDRLAQEHNVVILFLPPHSSN